jgi:hypothetical protein
MAKTFEVWMNEVDAILMTACGISSEDLVDCCCSDWHEDGISPKRAARMAIRNENGDE